MGNSSSNSFSIAQALQQLDKKPAEVKPTASLPNESFTLKQVEEVWEIFLNELQRKDSLKFNALETYQIEEKRNNEIHFLFETNAKCAEFETIKAELLQQLHQKLKNSYITIHAEIGNFESKNYVQTKEEMYRKMVEKNPLIEELRKKLDLDFY